MKLKVKTDPSQWIKATGEYQRIMAKAASAAVKASAKDAVTAGRESIAAGGFGSAFQSSLRMKMLSSGNVLNPAAWIHTTINFADVFQTGKVITKAQGYLWIPLPAVPAYPGAFPPRQMTVKMYQNKIGPLVFVRRPGKKPLLMAMIRRAPKAQPWGKFATKAKLKKGISGSRGRVEYIPMFVGTSSVILRRHMDVSGAIEQAYGTNLQQHYLENLEKYEGR